MTHVALGSMNPAKLRAVEAALNKVGLEARITQCTVPSGVRNQPLSDNETLRGALNRARQSREIAKAEYGIGLEGGVYENEYGMFLTSWAAIVTRKGEVSVGASPRFLLPDRVAREVSAGKELGAVLDELYGRTNVAHEEGAFGLFTTHIHRDDAFAQALLCALAPLRSEHYR